MSSYRLKFNVLYHRVERDDSEVSDFVKFITEVLEKEDPSIKGYYAGRDMLPGQCLVTRPFEIMAASEYTILVLDHDFIENDWSRFWSRVRFTVLYRVVELKKLSCRSHVEKSITRCTLL